jgi:hypothetical protein
MKRILFIYNHPYEKYWKDGLWAAIELLKKEYDVVKWNIAEKQVNPFASSVRQPRFILGWGGFRSPVDDLLQTISGIPKGLCLAGNAFPLEKQTYDVLFYETDWTKQWLDKTAQSPLPPLVKAFGYNSQMYFTTPLRPRIIDYLTVGAFASWKRQQWLAGKEGIRVAIGEIQKQNLSESMSIIGPLLMRGVMVSDMVPPEQLVTFYNLSKVCYLPATINGGGERATLEARACGCRVEIATDNPKLQEVLATPLYTLTEFEYAKQLKKGIDAVIEKTKSNSERAAEEWWTKKRLGIAKTKEQQLLDTNLRNDFTKE